MPIIGMVKKNVTLKAFSWCLCKPNQREPDLEDVLVELTLDVAIVSLLIKIEFAFK